MWKSWVFFSSKVQPSEKTAKNFRSIAKYTTKYIKCYFCQIIVAARRKMDSSKDIIHSMARYNVHFMLERDELVWLQKKPCKDISWVIFGFLLDDSQIHVIYTLIYQQNDLLLLAKTEFFKSLIFQLYYSCSLLQKWVIIFKPLRLLHAKQNSRINWIVSDCVITLNGENNKQLLKRRIAISDFTNRFTSSDIALSRMLKNILLDNLRFAERLCLLTIDEIHLVEQ